MKRSYSVLYGKATARKNKHFPNDGIFEVMGNKGRLKDNFGAVLANGRLDDATVYAAKTLDEFTFSGFDIQCYEEIKADGKDVIEPVVKKCDFVPPVVNKLLSGRSVNPREISTPSIAPRLQHTSKSYAVLYGKATARKNKHFPYDGIFEVIGDKGRLLDDNSVLLVEGQLENEAANAVKSLGEFYFFNFDIQCYEEIKADEKDVIEPVVNKCTSVVTVKSKELPAPSSSKSSDAHVIYAPCEKYPKGVEIAGLLAKVMREHQKLGVEFLFNALQETDSGAILADDMGLGKTLQSIALIHTMFNTKTQNKYKLVGRVLLLCPLSLKQNWLDEFIKWGLRNFCYIPNNKLEVERYIAISQRTPVCILNYNIVSSYHDILKMSKFDLMICDEGHVLKNSTKIRKQLLKLQARRRLILTGTPVQNSLKEFYQLTRFVNYKLFENQEDFIKQIRKKKAATFSQYFLRRTAEVNQKNLPPRHDFLIFCQPSKLQFDVYSKALDVISSNTFSMFNALRQICNHPALLKSNLRTPEYIDFARCINAFPSDFDDVNLQASDSGKLMTLAMMVIGFREEGDKTVVVSQSLQCLTMISILLTTLKFKVFRLDGAVQSKKRQSLVDSFNTSDDSNDIFLLSTHAGGVGLNLVGANRLIMYDASWNPAIDFQAMARTWREGQKKKAYIYRLFTAGTVEEKFLQLQIKKIGLASVINPWTSWSKKEQTFDPSELKNFDEFLPGVSCDTHDVIKCRCHGDGVISEDTIVGDSQNEEEKENEWDDEDDDEDFDAMEDIEETRDDDLMKQTRISLDQLHKWRHHAQGSSSFVETLALCGLFEDSPVSFIMETEFKPPAQHPESKFEAQAENTFEKESSPGSSAYDISICDTPAINNAPIEEDQHMMDADIQDRFYDSNDVFLSD